MRKKYDTPTIKLISLEAFNEMYGTKIKTDEDVLKQILEQTNSPIGVEEKRL